VQMGLETALAESLRQHTAEIDEWQPRSAPAPRRAGIARPALVGVTVLALAGAIGTGISLGFDSNDSPTARGGFGPLHGPAKYEPMPPKGCITQSTNRPPFFSTPGQAVRDAESPWIKPAKTAEPSVILPPPAGQIRRVSAMKYVDGGWTFLLTHNRVRGWGVTEIEYCWSSPGAVRPAVG
jgi:hypothetical protein